MRLPTVLLGTMLVPIALLLWFVTAQPLKVLPRITLAPRYVLTDQTGSEFTPERMRGQFALYTFTYTQCIDCTESARVFATLQERLSATPPSIPVHLVTIVFDPARDGVDRLARYAQAHGADPERWHVLTGDADHLKQVIGAGFRTYYAPAAGGGFDYDPTYILVDGNGIVRAEYRTATPDVERILRDIDLLETEVINSEGVARYAYEAAHLFLCYPG